MDLKKLFKPDKNRVSIMIYVVLTIMLSYLGIKLLGVSNDILRFTGNYLSKIYVWITPGIIGFIIAYLMFPLVNLIFKFISKPKFINDAFAKFISIILAYLFVIGMFIGFLYAMYISIGGQLSKNTNISQIFNFLSQFASNTASDKNISKITAIFENAGIHLPAGIIEKIAQLIIFIKEGLYSAISSIGKTFLSIGESLITIALGTILSIYFIKDANHFLSLGQRLFYIIFGNSKLGYNIKFVCSVFDKTFKKYMKGQLLEAFFVGILSIIVLSLCGVKYVLLIGIISGVTNMIPYVGPLIGTLLAGVMGILSGSFSHAIIGMVAMQVIQQIDGNILSPKIVGGMVGLHPVFTILALIIGGKFGGIIGMILAIPVAASLKIIINKWYESTGKDEDWTIFNNNIIKKNLEIEHDVEEEFTHKYKNTRINFMNIFKKENPKSSSDSTVKDTTSKENDENYSDKEENKTD